MYKELSNNDKPSENGEIPDAKEATEFCENIWSTEKQHDKNTSWLKDVHADYKNIRIPENITIFFIIKIFF